MSRLSVAAALLGAALCLFSFSSTPAQETKPQQVYKPAPKPGTRDYTRQKLDEFKAQQKKYADVCSRNAPLTDMQSELKLTTTSLSQFVNAAIDEIDDRPDMRKLVDEKDHLYAAYESLKKKGTDYEAELKAKIAWQKAFDKYDAALAENLESLGKAIGFATPITPQSECPQQEEAEEALKKQQAAETLKKVKADMAKPKTATGSPPKDNCPNNGGLSGNMEKVACEERGGK